MHVVIYPVFSLSRMYKRRTTPDVLQTFYNLAHGTVSPDTLLPFLTLYIKEILPKKQGPPCPFYNLIIYGEK